jgi:outer membrane protein insertion porin family
MAQGASSNPNLNMNALTLRAFCRFSLFLVGWSLAATVAWAVSPFTTRDIRIEGLQRVEPGTVFATLPFRVGETYTDEKGTAAIRALFGLGLFKDIRIEVKDDVVVVLLEERPIIASIDFIGTKEFDKDALRKALKEVGLSDGRPFDRSLADLAEQDIKRQYVNRSLYGVEIVTTITPVERNRVNLTFNVTEGDVAKIKQIQFVGNKVFKTSTLEDLMDLNSGNWMSWYTKSDRYSRPKLNADLETLRSFYLARGYLDFRIESTQVSISPNKQDLSVTINIFEGEMFAVSSVRLQGYYLGKDDEFKTMIGIKVGQAYNAEDVTKTTAAFTEYFGNFGFAFARVEAVNEIDRTNNRVALVLQADPSRRAYVRKINLTGNGRTRDEIIRREFRQLESAWYDGERIKLSRDRLKRLGYFKDVNIETQEVPGSFDQVDLLVKVEEKPLGSLQLGAGFSSAEKLVLTFGVQQDNIFGSGNFLGIQLSTSEYNKVISVATTNPYFTEDGISRTFSLSHRAIKPYIDQAGNYQTESTNAGVTFGVPMTELDRIFVGLAGEQTITKPGSNMPASLIGSCSYDRTCTSVPLTVGWARDGRDSAITPTKGRLMRANSELGVAADTRYTKTSAQYQQYFSLTKRYTLGLNGEAGVAQGLENHDLPIYKNFYAGGLGSVRGFEQGSLGPRDTTGLVVGGAKKLVLSSEFFIPFPGVGNDQTLRLFGFFDAGNVYGANDNIDPALMRTSTGAGISWISPVGPLRFAIAEPITKFRGDRIQKLQFQIGTSF